MIELRWCRRDGGDWPVLQYRHAPEPLFFPRSMEWASVPEVVVPRSPQADERQKWPVAVPPIGQPWRGGIYAGVCRGVNGERDYHLVVGKPEAEGRTWENARAWAHIFLDGGWWSLPTRREQSVLFANVPELFAKDWYWSGEEHEQQPGFAWVHSFRWGTQDRFLHCYEFRARAVRRIPLGDEHGR